MEIFRLSKDLSEVKKNVKPIGEFINDTLNSYFDKSKPELKYIAYLSVLKVCQELESRTQYFMDNESTRMNLAYNLNKTDREDIHKSVATDLQNFSIQLQKNREWYESILKSGKKLIKEHNLFHLWLSYGAYWYNFNKVTLKMISNICFTHNIQTIEDLQQYTPKQLSELKGVGKTTISYLQDFLHALAIDW